MQETNTIRFFRELASRMYKENDLSDILYALCESSFQFKQFVLDYFFPEEQLNANQASIQREVQYGDGSRPDFVIRCNEKTYFVEVKIWDRSHHFDQYARTIQTEGNSAESCLAYITNYTIDPATLSNRDKQVFNHVKQRVSTWQQFLDALKKKGEDPVERSWATGEDVQGFIEYCNEVCPSTDNEKVDSFSLQKGDFLKVREFYTNLNEALKNTLTVSGRQVSVEKYSKGKFNRPGDWVGMYFSAEGLLDKKIWGWIGWYLKNDPKTSGLCIEFLNKNGWGAPVFTKVGETQYQIDYRYNLDEVNVKTIQTKMEDAFQKVFNGIKPSADIPICQTPKQLRNMRQFSLFLEQNILNGLLSRMDEDESGPYIEIVQTSDSQNPSRWCGVNFDIVTKEINQEEVREKSRNRCWLGLYFDGQIHLDGKESEIGNRIVLEWNGKITEMYHLPDESPFQNLDKNNLQQNVRSCLENWGLVAKEPPAMMA